MDTSEKILKLIKEINYEIPRLNTDSNCNFLSCLVYIKLKEKVIILPNVCDFTVIEFEKYRKPWNKYYNKKYELNNIIEIAHAIKIGDIRSMYINYSCIKIALNLPTRKLNPSRMERLNSMRSMGYKIPLKLLLFGSKRQLDLFVISYNSMLNRMFG